MTLSDYRYSRMATWRLSEGLRRVVANLISGEYTTVQRQAGTAFIIRVASAGIAFVSQVLIARWIGGSQFGSYIYVWTCLLVASDIVHLGLPLTAQRFVPEYRETRADDLLRGYLTGSQWISFAFGLTIAGAFGLTVWLVRDHIDS